MWRRDGPKPLDEVDRWINECHPDDERRLTDVAHQYVGRPAAEVRAALVAAGVHAPATVLGGIATRISVRQRATGTRFRVRTVDRD
ncbi:hypothetical protein [Oerskovia flava]|uniref:hypothetical protein n=1 Tax=Oerskovia flava TaxID=2986422 RepID=UPI002240793E|nr:hypothetical protein [Oerskovia sp. JB1-3-2]